MKSQSVFDGTSLWYGGPLGTCRLFLFPACILITGFRCGGNVFSAVETCDENIANRENLHVPYGPLYIFYTHLTLYIHRDGYLIHGP